VIKILIAMAMKRTPSNEDIREEILNLTAGEKEWTLPSYQGEMIKEGKSEAEGYQDTSKGLETEVGLLRRHVRELQGKAKELEETVEEDLARWSKDKIIVKPAELTAGEYDIKLPYHPQETPSDIEEAEEARMKLAPKGDKKETSQENSASDFKDMKIFFEYIIRKQNEESKVERKAIQDSVNEIEKSVKRAELKSERLHRELLESLHSETKKNTDLINQVKKVTEEEIIRFDEKITEVCEELENKLEINSAQINSVVEELTDKVIVNENGTEDKFQKLDKRQIKLREKYVN
jgi:hypothetical protein